MKVPVELVITEVGNVETVIVPNFTVTAEFAVKFDPVMVISVPVKPPVGDKLNTPPAATVKVADPILPDASVAVIV
jgi:hypothetical protein